MKRILAVFTSGILLFSSCNSGSKETEETKSADTTTTVSASAATPTVAEPAFTPFKAFMVQHKVKNFDKWKAAYMSHDSMRQAYGISQMVIGRGLQDSNWVIVIDKMSDVQKAKQFSTLPNLKDAMSKAGVTGPPKFSYANVIRNDDSKIDQQDRIMVVHKVKNFDTWLKAYDAEGKATREANGMLDRGMARNIEDSNMVSIVFAITDMAKAKARINSPGLKKIMTDAGVAGPPQIYYYKLVE